MSSHYVDTGYWPDDYAQLGITIDWKNRIIFVPKTETTLIQTSPVEIRSLDVNFFRQVLKDLEDDEVGMNFIRTHNHNPPVTVGGATLARVVELINNYTVTFEDGQYAVNLVGANNNIGDVTNVNQVSVRSANSAGLQDLNSLQAASFNGGVAIHTGSSYTGSLFPVGTRQYPVNNLADALIIAHNRGLKEIFVTSNLTISTENFSSGFLFTGDNVNLLINILPGANISSCEFNNATIVGTLDNNNLFRDCGVSDLTNVDGIMQNCGLFGTLKIAGNSPCIVLECFSILQDQNILSLPALDLVDIANDLTVRGFNGELHIVNCTNPDIVVSIDFDAGVLYLENSCTAGTFIVRGNAEIIDNSSTVTIINKTLQKSIPELTWNSSLEGSVSDSYGEKILKNLPK